MQKKKFGQILLEKRLVSPQDIERCLEIQRSDRKRRIGVVMLDEGIISEEIRCRTLAEQFNWRYVSKEDFSKDIPPLEGSILKFINEHNVLPISSGKDKDTVVAVSDPLDIYTLEAVRMAFGPGTEFAVASLEDIKEAVEAVQESMSSSMDDIVGDMEDIDLELANIEDENEDVSHLRHIALEAPVIRLVNLIIVRAVERRASDIHIELFEDNLRVRYRIDGNLQTVESPPRRLHAAIVSRVKILAKLNIAERRIPQDGRIKLKVKGKWIDIRVATLPTIYGENVVMRILDREAVVLKFDTLGFPEYELGRFMSLLSMPHGMILVTGPTGSGKTTTLYTALTHLNKPGVKIVSIEDPVEYHLDGINQIHVNPKINLTFASGLRSILRQDPNIIMVGEIRDSETADIAIRSALTGHLVFSTVHTNDAAGAVVRLRDMGVPNYLVSSSIIGILAQRLVRTICPKCKEGFVLTETDLPEFAHSSTKPERLFKGKGCEECAFTGYHGRTGIYEQLILDDELRQYILKDIDAGTFKMHAVKKGMKTLKESGLDKVVHGITTLDEVRAVTEGD